MNQLINLSVFFLFGCTQLNVQNQETSAQKKNNDISIKIQSTDTLAILQTMIDQAYPGYDQFDWSIGDINEDGKEDIVMIVEGFVGGEDKDETQRIVLFFVQTQFPKYEIATTNNHVVDPYYYGDSHSDVIIEDGNISFISLHGGFSKTEKVKVFNYNSKEKDWFYKETHINNYHYDEKLEEVVQYFKVITNKETGIIRFEDFKLDQE